MSALGRDTLPAFVVLLLSHPADSLVSLSNAPQFRGCTLQEIIQRVGWYQLATKGLAPRILVTGQVISVQWLLYDTFKQLLGYGTSGG